MSGFLGATVEISFCCHFIYRDAKLSVITASHNSQLSHIPEVRKLHLYQLISYISRLFLYWQHDHKYTNKMVDDLGQQET
jgi:hypothetical protein